MLPVEFFYSILVVCCLYALAKGGPPERSGAAIFAVTAVLFTASLSAHGQRYASVEIRALGVDVAMLVALTFLAVKAERFWPIWVTALQAIGTAGHLVKLVDPQVLRVGYSIALALWSYPMLLLLVIGTYCHQRRLARHGVDRSWSSSWDQSAPPHRSGPIN